MIEILVISLIMWFREWDFIESGITSPYRYKIVVTISLDNIEPYIELYLENMMFNLWR